MFFKDYIGLLKEKFLRRCLIKLGYEIINSGYITNFPLETLLNELENKIYQLTIKIQSPKIPTTVITSYSIHYTKLYDYSYVYF